MQFEQTIYSFYFTKMVKQKSLLLWLFNHLNHSRRHISTSIYICTIIPTLRQFPSPCLPSINQESQAWRLPIVCTAAGNILGKNLGVQHTVSLRLMNGNYKLLFTFSHELRNRLYEVRCHWIKWKKDCLIVLKQF